MAYEDLFWDIDREIKKRGLQKKFNVQLEKMKLQDKHKYKDVRDQWDYAYNKVIKEEK